MNWPPVATPCRSNPPEGAVGIVLPIRNDTRFFKLCFYSLLAFTDYRFMLTVVDADSTPATLPTLENLRQKYRVNVLQYPKPHNLAAEWNLGLRFMFSFATVKYGVVIRPTVIFEPLWLTCMIHALQDDPTIGTSIPCTEGEASDVLLFRREVFEGLGGFDERALDPAKNFVLRSINAGSSTGMSGAFVHRIKRDRPKQPAAAQETQEATHART